LWIIARASWLVDGHLVQGRRLAILLYGRLWEARSGVACQTGAWTRPRSRTCGRCGITGGVPPDAHREPVVRRPWTHRAMVSRSLPCPITCARMISLLISYSRRPRIRGTRSRGRPHQPFMATRHAPQVWFFRSRRTSLTYHPGLHTPG
jgi:hypothetical protein